MTGKVGWEVRKKESRKTPEFVALLTDGIAVPITDVRNTRRQNRLRIAVDLIFH